MIAVLNHYNNMCSNCNEELYILSFQSEHVENISIEFQEKAAQQSK